MNPRQLFRDWLIGIAVASAPTTTIVIPPSSTPRNGSRMISSIAYCHSLITRGESVGAKNIRVRSNEI